MDVHERCFFRPEGGPTILMTNTSGLHSPEDVKNLVLKALDADKALEIEMIDLRGQSALADFMIIASGTSSRHIGALASKLTERLHARPDRGLSAADPRTGRRYPRSGRQQAVPARPRSLPA